MEYFACNLSPPRNDAMFASGALLTFSSAAYISAFKADQRRRAGDRMRRRNLIAAIGTAAVFAPFIVHAQRRTLPVIGFIKFGSADAYMPFVAAFKNGLRETGFVEGRDLVVDYRWVKNDPAAGVAALAELVHEGVQVIFAAGSGEAVAAKAATTTIPIVFYSAGDPVALGLVQSFNRPGANVTGISRLSHALGAKRLELVRQLVPRAKAIALLVRSDNPSAAIEIEDHTAAAQALGLQAPVFDARAAADIEHAFDVAAADHVDALVVAGSPFFTAQREGITKLAARHALPAIYPERDYVEAGGLVSYGASFADSWRQAGAYVGRILKGEKPGDLPVQQPTAFELVISSRTAKTLGLDIPQDLLATANEVIE
jgi:putative ABC transport system substrate-binding protein